MRTDHPKLHKSEYQPHSPKHHQFEQALMRQLAQERRPETSHQHRPGAPPSNGRVSYHKGNPPPPPTSTSDATRIVATPARSAGSLLPASGRTVTPTVTIPASAKGAASAAPPPPSKNGRGQYPSNGGQGHRHSEHDRRHPRDGNIASKRQ